MEARMCKREKVEKRESGQTEKVDKRKLKKKKK